MPLRIYLVEDHATLRDLISKWINKLPGMTICGAANTGQQALDEIPDMKPDLVLVDIRLPDISGLDVVNRLHMQNRKLGAIMHTSNHEMSLVRKALAVGARGYLLKGKPWEIEIAIRHVIDGKIYLSPQLGYTLHP